MDLLSLLIIAGICILCLLPVVFRSLRGLDRHADDIQGSDPETAEALRKARESIDRGKGWYGP
ncbi:hypothetical protein ACFUCV_02200 [Specibacter sp. NPDC057265]|uniref:hypothetical protein n=1 Tax=Specibacter sp. NPDC057265 TaxID=3346075 RepID=UPI00364482D7